MRLPSAPIVSLDELKALLEGLKPRPKTVLTNGVFDILHAGHASYLEAASNLGDILIVALNDDASALALKGKDRPVLKLEDRLRLVASFRWVDYVTWFSELKLDRVLEALRPDIHAKGVDYGGTGVPEARLAESLGVQVALVGEPKRLSTTGLIAHIRNTDQTC